MLEPCYNETGFGQWHFHLSFPIFSENQLCRAHARNYLPLILLENFAVMFIQKLLLTGA